MSETKLRKVNGVRLYQGRMGYKTIKMLRPICEECQSQDRAPGWWYRCEARGHTPYFTTAQRTELTPKLSEPDEQGRRKVLGQDETIWYEESPNLTAVPMTGRHNGDENTALRVARGKGFRMPEEMGIAPFCQYSDTHGDCWAQDGLTSYPFGQFCSVDQAKAIAADQRGIKLEVLNEEKKAAQWASIAV